MSVKATMLCCWHDYSYARHRFEARNEPGAECRASMAEKIVTVWLPNGAKVRLRNNTRKRWVYLYGTHTRMNRTKITMELLK